MPVLDSKALEGFGFRELGTNVRISDKASFYNCAQISIGSNVRIDDFCVLSAGTGGITIGSYVHIAVYSSLIGAGSISLDDFSNVSSRVAIYSSTDDFSGEWMTNPMVPEQLTGVVHGSVYVKRHAIIGAGSVILPGVTVKDGAAVGALSLVKQDCEEFGVYAGIPAKRIADRKRDLLRLERDFLSNSRL